MYNDRKDLLKNPSDSSRLDDRDSDIHRRSGEWHSLQKSHGVKAPIPGHGQSVKQALHDNISVTGNLNITVIRKDGTREEREGIENMVVYSGLGMISDLLCGVITTPITKMWIGTGGREDAENVRAPLMSNTRLYTFYTEGDVTAYRDNVVGDEDRGYQAISRFAHTFAFTEEVHINEAALATASVSSDAAIMLNQRTFYDRVMYNGDFLELVWDMVFSRYINEKSR